MFRTPSKLFVSTVVVVVFAAALPSASAQQRPTLYLVTIGVSEFAKPIQTVTVNGLTQTSDLRNGVKYASKDATEIAAFFKGQENKLFGKVVAKSLTDAQATKQNIEEAMAWLGKQQILANDYVIVFVAGHGEPRGFAPHDDDLSGDTTIVRWTMFRDTLVPLPGNRMLVLDTCFAGSAALVSDRKAGLITIAACMGFETSSEDPNQKNGKFTLALLEGLQGKADADKDGNVTLAELYTYVSNRLIQLTAGRQNPTVEHPATVRLNLPIAQLGQASSASTVAANIVTGPISSTASSSTNGPVVPNGSTSTTTGPVNMSR